MHEYQDELAADFQQYYSLDIGGMGLEGHETTRDVLRAATLLSQLPSCSRVARREHPDAEWGAEAMFLRLVEYELRGVLYALGGAKGEKPRPIELPSERLDKERALAEAERVRAEVDEALRGFLPDF